MCQDSAPKAARLRAPDQIGPRLAHRATHRAPLLDAQRKAAEAEAGDRGEMVRTDLHYASQRGDAALVERLLKQHPHWVHEKCDVRSARVG